MKKVIALVLLMSFVLMGCSGGEKKKPAADLTDKYTLEDKAEEIGEGENKSTIKYPVAKGFVSKEVEQAVNEAIGKRIATYKELAQLGGDIEESLSVTYEVTYKTKEIFSVVSNVVSIIQMEGEPFEDTIKDAVTFDLRYGELATVQSLLKKPGDIKKFTGILEKKIKEKNPQANTSEMLKDIDKNNHNFYIKENAIVFVYTTTGSLTDMQNILEVEIPFTEVKDMFWFLNEDIKKQSSKSIEDYNSIVNEKTKPSEALFFVEDIIKKASSENALTMILSIEEIQQRYISSYEESLYVDDVQSKLYSVFGNSFDKDKVDNIKDESLKYVIQEILDGGYTLINTDGSFTIIQDYGAYEKFIQYLPEDMGEYISIKVEETNQLKGLNKKEATWGEISEGIIKSETFMIKYPDSIKENEVSKIYKNYFRQYLYGKENITPFHFETGKIDEKLLDSYKKFVSQNRTSETARLLETYLTILESNNYQLSEEVDQFRSSVTQEESE